MTRVTVNPGICGFTVTVRTEKKDRRSVSVEIETDCEMVRKMAEDLGHVDMMAAFTNHLNNPVYKSAAKHLKHVTCPVPSGILKAVEAELGLAIPRDASIIFIKE